MNEPSLGQLAHFCVELIYHVGRGRYEAHFRWTTPDTSTTYDTACLRPRHQQTDLFNEVSMRVGLWIDDCVREASLQDSPF